MADKKFTLTFDVEGNIGPIKKSINEFQSTVKNSKVKIPVNIQGNIDKTIAKLTDEIENFETIAGQGFTNMAEIGKAEKSFLKISSLMKQLGKYGDQIGGLDPKKFLPKETIDRVEKLQRSWNKVNTIIQKGEANKSAIEKQTKAIKEQREALNELTTERKKLNAENIEAGRRKSGLTNKTKADEKRRDEVQLEMSELEKVKGGKSSAEYKKLSSELKVLNTQIEANRKEYTALDAAISKNKTTIAGLDVSIKDANTSLTDMEAVLEQLQQAVQNPKELEDLRQELAGLTEVSLDKIPTDLEEIRKIIDSLDDAELKNIEEAFKKIQTSGEDTKQAIKEAGDAFEETSKQGAEFEKTADQINRLKSQIIDFFSIGNTIQIFKSAIRDAFNTVKELDAAMTETAVVTDFSIGDMWEKLPEYSARASELGASTKSLYEATTLYYQQGLQSAEAMDVGIETMKMARIANMDAANATEAMTAALRGFNMEINETSAGRINDVYSELAAITASDTQQIATAMTKTASIAYSANMEFETTAALLAQIIETTQEAPETAGTAMKTIIARFTEVKQLFDKGMLSGEDSEGEIIDINKIDAALKTVGISLKDFLTGTKGIDDIFLELASKWDTLDLATQRYIATTAAGSRQQSRFIAMMSNYDRTMELVNAANNSAGASTEQFNKTLESLDAKLQRLNNAWQEFTMNLANNEIIKMFVDLLADGLETINSVTDALSGGNGMIKSFLTLVEVAMGLKAGGSIFRSIFSGFKQEGDSKGIFDYAQEILAIFSKDDDSAKGGILKQIFELIAGNEEASDSLQELGDRVSDTQEKLSGLFGKFGPWTLLIIGMAVAVYQLVKAFQAAQTSAQLENLNEQLKELEQESERVKNKISEIGDSKNNLGSLQDTLYGLTKGTSEWKQALMDVNTEVLRLIEKYPELELTSGHYGELAISEESWDALLDKQEQVISNIGAMTVATQIQKAELETQMTYDDFIINSGYGLEAKTKVVKESPWKNLFATAGLLNTATGIPVTLDEQSQKVLEASQGETSIKKVELSEFERSLNYFSQIALPRFFDSSFGTKGSTWGDIITSVSEGLANANSGYTSNSAILTNTHEQIKQDGGYLRVAQEKITGLASEEFMKLSAAWYDAGLYFANDTFDEEMAYAIYRDLGFTDNQVFASIVAEGKRLGGEFDNLATSAWNLANKEELLADSYINNALAKSTKISGSDTEKGIQGLINSIESREDYDTRLDEKTALIEETYRSREKELARQYAELTGKHYEAGKIWSDSSMADEIQIDYSEMAKAVAEIQLQVDYQNMGEAILKGLVGLNKQEKDLFNSVFGKDGQAITSEQIKKYTSEDGINIDQIVKDMGYDNLVHMAEEMKLEPTEVLDTVMAIVENFEQAQNRIAEARQGIIKNMSKYSKDILPKTFKENAKILENWEIKFGEEIRNDLTTFFDKMAQTGDEDLTSTALEQLYQTLEQTGNEQEIGKVFDFINTIDFSNPIEALDAINNEIENGTGAARDFAKTLKETESPYFGLQSQLSSFVGSEDFQGVQEELAEILETNKEISATDVYDLADSYKSLNKLLKNNNITAAGLAKTLEGIQKGEFTVSQLTDAVLASISTFDSLDSIVAKTVRDFENFDLGIDENTVADTIADWVGVLENNLEKGAVGNSQNFRILDYLFPGWSEDLEGDALVDKMTYLTKKLKGNGQNLRTMWSDLAAGKDVYGNDISFETATEEKFSKLDVDDTGSEILFSGWEGMNLTSKDLITWISDAYNVSTETANAMLVDFKNNSKDLALELRENDYTSGIQDAYDKLKSLDEVKIISEEEIEAISKLTGKSIDTVRQDLQNKGAQTVDLYDDEGKLRSLEDIILQAESAVLAAKNASEDFTYDFTSDFITKTEKGIESIDLKAFEKKLGQLNIFGADAEGLKEQLFEQTIAGLKEGAEGGKAILVETLADGHQIEIEVTANTTLEEVNQSITRQSKEHDNETLAKAFENIEFKIAPDMAGMEELKSILDTIGQGVPFSWSEESIEAAKAEIQAVAETTQTTPVILDVISSDIGSWLYTRSINILLKVKKQEIDDAVSQIQEEVGDGHAKGIRNSPTTHDALVSEEGPELIQRADGSAYLSGLEGPEIAKINYGDTVYTAEETREILKKRKHQFIPGFSSGYGNGTAYHGTSGGKGGGGNSSSEEDKWENPFDKLYNLLRKIDEELRERERIERRYEKLLEGIDTSANKIIKISREELTQLEKERMLQEQLVDGRKWQIEKYQKENADLSRYAAVTENERGESVLRIDWDLIDQITDTEQGERIEAYVSQLEEWFDTLEEAEDALWEIEDTVEEIKERGKDEYFELEDLIKEALTQFYQEEIDKLNSINTSINDTNSSLLEAVQKSIDKQRQDRENNRTERELSEKQRRLAYLQQDTSGANALEILKLQEEIAEGQEDYTDTLIDQKISELQEQNEEAAKQREQQITLLQTQLDHYLEMGGIWEEVYALIDEGLDRDTGLIRGSTLESLLKSAEGFAGLSAIGQMEWLKETNSMIAQALAYLEVGRQLEDIGITEGTQIDFVTKDGKTMTGTVDAKGNVVGADGKTYNNVYQGVDGKYYAGENIEDVKEPVVEGVPGNSSNSSNSEAEIKNNPYGRASDVGTNYYYSRTGKTIFGGTPVKAIQWALKDMGYNPGSIDGAYGGGTSSAVKAFQRAVGISADGDYGPDTREQFRLKGYNRGGLADFTGPAWLDGTKARPEIVLDAQDSRNFIQLRDILGSLLNRGSTSSTSTENNGDITYDIDINVESIGNDYDVEQMANKVKNLIGEDARYRNNNAVSLKK